MFGNASPVTSMPALPVKERRLGIIIIMSVLLALSGGINILLARKVSSLSLILEWERKLGVGTPAPPLIAHTSDGIPASITFSEHGLPTVLYVFSPQCIWCTRNLDNIKTIESSQKGRYRFIGLSMSSSSLKQYIASNNLSFPIYENPDERSVAEFKLRGTPLTLVTSQAGIVIKNWYGAYSGNQQRDIEKFFGVTLPGIRMDELDK